jgi:hypothetical protein
LGQAFIVSRIALAVASEAGLVGRVAIRRESHQKCRKTGQSGVKILRFCEAALVATQ